METATRIWVKFLAIVLVAATVSIGITVALTSTVSHTVPPSNPQIVTSTCITLTLSTPTTTTGSSGVELLTCGPNPAFDTIAGSSVPAFTLGAGYTSLRFLSADPNSNPLANCGNGSGTIMTSGSAVTFSPGSWDYCGIYANAPAGGLGSFTIQWAQ